MSARGFQFIRERDAETMSRRAAELLVAEVAAKPDLLLCVATGGTPTRCYELLVEKARASRESLAGVALLRLLKLDEWGGLPMDHPATCEYYLQQTLITPLGISADRYTAFHSERDPTAECKRIEALLGEQSPIDVCVLGLGVNGHLGFNEPAAFLQPGAHVARLSAESLAHSMVRDVTPKPTFGLTLGIGHILQARKILLLVSGPTKQAPLRRLMSREITSEFPASFLWLHADVTCICDETAAAYLPRV